MKFDRIPKIAELLAGFPGLKAIFFDMDGTLLNTEPYHTKAFEALGARFHIRPPFAPEQVHQLLVGKADHLVYEVVKCWEGFPKDWSARDFVEAKTERLMEILSQIRGEDFFPEASRKLLTEAKALGLKTGLVTSSEKVVTTKMLKMVRMENFFDVVVTRDDCPVHKPDPYPYNLALKTLSLSPGEVIIFEDSQVGISAAKASGAHVGEVGWF